MPILGIGTDIVEVGRIRDVCEREPGFVNRVFTAGELEYSLAKETRYMHLAVRFAAKEAVAKALGTSLSWQDVEVANDPSGRPRVILHGKARGAVGNATIHISISHTRQYATAVAVVEEQ